MKRCANPLCQEPTCHTLCPSCRLMGKWGMFVGGLAVGIITAILKLLKVL